VVFGDPFQGAPIKGFPSAKIKTYCNEGDKVCDGRFTIKAAHLKYATGSTSDAVSWIKSQASSSAN
jgi:cutinase